jgi:hypothetical protein
MLVCCTQLKVHHALSSSVRTSVIESLGPFSNCPYITSALSLHFPSIYTSLYLPRLSALARHVICLMWYVAETARAYSQYAPKWSQPPPSVSNSQNSHCRSINASRGLSVRLSKSQLQFNAVPYLCPSAPLLASPHTPASHTRACTPRAVHCSSTGAARSPAGLRARRGKDPVADTADPWRHRSAVSAPD